MQGGVGLDHWGTWSILWGEHSFCEGVLKFVFFQGGLHSHLLDMR